MRLNTTPSRHTEMPPADRQLELHRSLASFTRHTSRDTIVIATMNDADGVGRPEVSPLTQTDVDRLELVLRPLNLNHVNVIMHGAGGTLATAATVIELLRGKYTSIRAMIPKMAVSGMALIACACDVIMMSETAVIGSTDRMAHQPLRAQAAVQWMDRYCQHPDRAARVAGVARVFSATGGSRIPLKPVPAMEIGLPVKIIPERSAIGCDLARIQRAVTATIGYRSTARLIESQKELASDPHAPLQS